MNNSTTTTTKLLPFREYETSIRLPISETIYQHIYNSMVNEEDKNDIILYFEDDKRISNNKCQYKHINTKKCLMKILYYNDRVYFIPYVRKSSDEYLVALPEVFSVNSIIIRQVIFEGIILEDFKMRIALEKCTTNKMGLVYSLTAEVEYSQMAFVYYRNSTAVEEAFFNELINRVFIYLEDLDTSTLFKVPDSTTIIDVASRVFKHLNSSYTPSKSEAIVFKYDGFKGKIVMTANGLSYYDSLHNKYTGNCFALNDFRNIFFQVEVLEDNFICLVDILGGYTSNVTTNEMQHIPKPLEVMKFFDWMRDYLFTQYGLSEPYQLELDSVPVQQFKLFLQKPINPEALPVCNHQHDGYIIIESDKLFKCKIPTIDIVFVNGYMEVSDRVGSICNEYYPKYDNDSKKIYEVCQKATGTGYNVLRERFDRSVPSTNEQFEAFEKELKFLRTAISASTDKKLLKLIENMGKSIKIN